jgi:hypothetical protein
MSAVYQEARPRWHLSMGPVAGNHQHLPVLSVPILRWGQRSRNHLFKLAQYPSLEKVARLAGAVMERYAHHNDDRLGGELELARTGSQLLFIDQWFPRRLVKDGDSRTAVSSGRVGDEQLLPKSRGHQHLCDLELCRCSLRNAQHFRSVQARCHRKHIGSFADCAHDDEPNVHSRIHPSLAINEFVEHTRQQYYWNRRPGFRYGLQRREAAILSCIGKMSLKSQIALPPNPGRHA